MKIEASDIDVSKLLKMGIIVIPRFQRPYSWKTDNIRDFWADITSSDEGSYFIGSMVIYSMKQDRFGVVDGQQRLTTITFLLCAIRDHFARLGQEELAKGVHNFIETRDRENVLSFILKTETSFPYLQDKIQRFGDPQLDLQPQEEERRLQLAYNILHKNVEEYVKSAASGLLARNEQLDAKVAALKALREIVFNLKLIKIELDDEDDAYVIFETLNTRGQDLTLSDLLKNSIGSFIEGEGDVDVLKLLWAEISSNIAQCGEAVKPDTFFVHSWSSRFPAVTKQKAFKAFKVRLRESIGVAGEGSGAKIATSHLRAFKSDAERYLKIYQPRGAFPKYQQVVEESLVALRIFNVEQQMPYVLALLRSFDEKKIAFKALRKALTSVEKFHFLFNAITSQRSSGSIASMYARAARLLHESTNAGDAGAVISSVQDDLRERRPGREEFVLQFRNLSYNPRSRSNALLRYILSKLAKEEGLQFDDDADQLTIEHIFPRSHVGGIWTDEVAHSIGNLMLLSHKRNKQVDNWDYADKHRVFLQWGDGVPHFVRMHANWTPDVVNQRVQEMADLAYRKVWSI